MLLKFYHLLLSIIFSFFILCCMKNMGIEAHTLNETQNNKLKMSFNISANPMNLADIDPINNPASYNWLTDEVRKQVGKHDVSDLTQEDFNKIDTIILNSQGIIGIPKEIGNLFNLKKLELNINQITTIPKEFSNLSNLIYLSINYNQINEISKEITNLNSLEYLSLINNEINVIPKEIANLKQLEFLTLSNNSIRNIPPEICVLNNLISLFLDNNQIEEIPKEIGNLNNLKTLLLEHNCINKVPKEIGNLSDLVSLNLNGNKISELPQETVNLINLETLNLGSNNFTQVPVWFGNLINLTQLNLSNNKLGEVPVEIYNLTNLKYFNLGANQLMEVSNEIKKLTNLEHLFLQDQIVNLPIKSVNESKSFNIENPVKIYEVPVIPQDISNNGQYNKENNCIIWSKPISNSQEFFKFLGNVKVGNASSAFSGTVYQSIIIKDYETELKRAVNNANLVLDSEATVNTLLKCIYDLSISLQQYESNNEY